MVRPLPELLPIHIPSKTPGWIQKVDPSILCPHTPMVQIIEAEADLVFGSAQGCGLELTAKVECLMQGFYKVCTSFYEVCVSLSTFCT